MIQDKSLRELSIEQAELLRPFMDELDFEALVKSCKSLHEEVDALTHLKTAIVEEDRDAFILALLTPIANLREDRLLYPSTVVDFFSENKQLLWDHLEFITTNLGTGKSHDLDPPKLSDYRYSPLTSLKTIREVNEFFEAMPDLDRTHATGWVLNCKLGLLDYKTLECSGEWGEFRKFIARLPKDKSIGHDLPVPLLEIPATLLEQSPELLQCKGVPDQLLSYAISNSNIKRLEELESIGVDLKGEYERRGLLECSIAKGYNQRRPLVLWMIQKGLPFETPNSEGALATAVTQGSVKAVKLLLSNGCPVSDSAFVASLEHPELFDKCLNAGGNVDAVVDGTSLFAHALYKQDHGVFRTGLDVITKLLPLVSLKDIKDNGKNFATILLGVSDETKTCIFEGLKLRREKEKLGEVIKQVESEVDLD